MGRIFVPRAIPGAANTGPTARPRRFSFVACCAFNTRRRGPKSNTTVAVFPARRCPSTESVPGISSRRPVRLPPSRLVRIGSRACGNRSVPVSVPNRRTPRWARIAQLQAEEILREDAASRRARLCRGFHHRFGSRPSAPRATGLATQGGVRPRRLRTTAWPQPCRKIHG